MKKLVCLWNLEKCGLEIIIKEVIEKYFVYFEDYFCVIWKNLKL